MSPHHSLGPILQLARNVARALSRDRFDPHVIRAVFRHFEVHEAARRIYLDAIGGGTGRERGSHAKQAANVHIAQAVARELNARTTGEVVHVSDGFIESYSVLARP